MSRQRAVETLKRLFVALNAGDRDATLACLAPEVAFDTFEGVREIGREAVRRVLAERGSVYRESMRDLVLMTEDSGRRGAAEFTLRGIYQGQAQGMPAASGQAFSVPGGAFFDIEDNGLVARASFVLNAAELVRQLEK
jgi:steroid delta-isomerase-like uncharacterized protein